MESNKMFFAYFFMALNRPNGTMYVYHCFFPSIPQSILYYTLFHIIYVILIAIIVLCSKCPSGTFSNIFLFLGISILVPLSF
jgi:hypothetical protein